MRLKPLGNTGVQLPELALGTWQYRGGVEALRSGIELGAFFIDTAELYGTEPVVGRRFVESVIVFFLPAKFRLATFADTM